MKKNNVFILAFLCLIFFLKDSKGQDVFSSNLVNIKHDNGLSNLMKVNKSRGVPKIEIPLFNVVSGKISFPVVLNYNARGVKVDQPSGWVGLGWSISSPGVIEKQNISHKNIDGEISPDFYYSWGDASKFHEAIGRHSVKFLIGSPPFLRYEDIYRGLAYYQPRSHDIYSFKVGDTGGSFVPDKEQMLLIPKKDMYIDKDLRYILDSNGVQYNFEDNNKNRVCEMLTEKYSVTMFGGAEFTREVTLDTTKTYLNTMISSNKQDTIGFSYQSQPQFLSKKFSRHIKEYPPFFSQDMLQGGSFAEEDVVKSDLSDSFELKEVFYKHGKIVFIPSEVYKNKLGKIKVFRKKTDNSFELYKEFHFKYVAVEVNDMLCMAYGLDMESRVFLEEITETISNEIIAKMSYDDTVLLPPVDVPDGFDHWGYYNGKHSMKLVEPFYNYTHKRPIHLGRIPAIDWIDSYGNKLQLGDANRESSESYMKAGILKSIKTTYGGTIKYEFEANSHSGRDFTYENKYADPTDKNTPKQVGGLRIAKVTQYDENGQFVKGKLYKYHKLNETNTTSGKLTSCNWPPLYHKVSNDYFVAAGGNVRRKHIEVFSDAILGVNSDHILYQDVLEYDINEEGEYLGCIYSKYNFTYDKRYSFDSPNISNSWDRGKKTKEVIYKIESNQHIPVKSKTFNYYNNDDDDVIKAFHIGVNNPYHGQISDVIFDSLYNTVNYYYRSERVLLNQILDSTFNGAGNKAIVVAKTIDYVSETGMPFSVQTNSSDGNIVKEYYSYKKHKDISTNAIIYKPEYDQKYLNNTLVAASKIEYNMNGDPVKLYARDGTGKQHFNDAFNINFQLEKIYEYSDSNTVISEKTIQNGSTVSYVWGYNNAYVVAEIVNASTLEIENILGAGYNLGNNGLSDFQEKQLRERLPNAFITTCTYIPLIGKTSETDPNGKTTYYAYDKHGRLTLIKDENKRVIKKYKYHSIENL